MPCLFFYSESQKMEYFPQITIKSMKFPHIFSKKENRHINKEASKRPAFARDYTTLPVIATNDNSTAFSCLDRIASEFALLNFGIYDQKTRQKVKNHSLYAVLKEPNLEERKFIFLYQSCLDYFNGGCYWLIRRFQGEVVSLFRLNPQGVTIRRTQNTNRKEFLYNGAVLTDKDVLYIPSRFNYSTLTGGGSIFDAVSSAFQTAQSIETFANASFQNGFVGKRPLIDISGAYPEATAAQLKQLKDSFQAEYAGAQNAGRPLIKQKGIEYTAFDGGGDNQSQELAKNREAQNKLLSQVFGFPVSLLDGTSKDLEADFTQFLQFALRPVATQFEEAINNLLDESLYYFEFDYNGVLKVSLQQRIDAYTKQINNGILSLNDVLAKENMQPIEAGDTHFMPVNMMPWNEEIKDAYMAKQKQTIAETSPAAGTPTDPDAQHMPQGDDKQ